MLNNVSLIGRFVHQPELRATTSGTEVCSFTIAVDNGFGDKKSTSFLDCVAWRKTAEFISKHFTKGQWIAVSGSLQTRNYQDKDGHSRKTTEVLVANAYFVGDKKSAETSEFESIEDADDLPF